MKFNPNKRGTFKAVTPSQGRAYLIAWIIVVIAFCAILEFVMQFLSD